jgi:hypothetical protein
MVWRCSNDVRATVSCVLAWSTQQTMIDVDEVVDPLKDTTFLKHSQAVEHTGTSDTLVVSPERCFIELATLTVQHNRRKLMK